MQQLLSKQIMAKTLGISTRTLERMVVAGELTPLRIRRRVLFTPADLAAFLAALPK